MYTCILMYTLDICRNVAMASKISLSWNYINASIFPVTQGRHPAKDSQQVHCWFRGLTIHVCVTQRTTWRHVTAWSGISISKSRNVIGLHLRWLFPAKDMNLIAGSTSPKSKSTSTSMLFRSILQCQDTIKHTHTHTHTYTQRCKQLLADLMKPLKLFHVQAYTI